MLLHSQHDVHLLSFGSYDLAEAFQSTSFMRIVVTGSYQTHSFNMFFPVSSCSLYKMCHG
jgi:hypothetical protein